MILLENQMITNRVNHFYYLILNRQVQFLLIILLRRFLF